MAAKHTTYAGFIREKIAEGKTDEQIWKAMLRKWPGIEGSRRGYIAWYRREQRRLRETNDNAPRSYRRA